MRSNRVNDAIMSVKRILPWIKGDGHLLYNLPLLRISFEPLPQAE